jgi:hypothetical protein
MALSYNADAFKSNPNTTAWTRVKLAEDNFTKLPEDANTTSWTKKITSSPVVTPDSMGLYNDQESPSNIYMLINTNVLIDKWLNFQYPDPVTGDYKKTNTLQTPYPGDQHVIDILNGTRPRSPALNQNIAELRKQRDIQTKTHIKNNNDVFAQNEIQNKIAEESNIKNDKLNKENIRKNQANKKLNEENATVNRYEDTIQGIINNTTGGDYLSRVETVNKIEGLPKDIKDNFNRDFPVFYVTEKLKSWDPKTYIQPPTPDTTDRFDWKWYKTQVTTPNNDPWKKAVESKDLDITARYLTEESYYRWHYTTQGKQNGIRGYKEETPISYAYKEQPTDAEIQEFKDIAAGILTPNLETFLGTILDPKEKENLTKYGALTQNVLKDTIAELNKTKLKEQEYDLYRGLGAFTEIADFNKTIVNSIVGDSGVGGFLKLPGNQTTQDFTGTLEKQLGQITGLQNNVTHNWQKWFDDTLIEKYGIDYKQFASTEDTLDIVNAALKTKPEDVYDTKRKVFTDPFIKKAGFKTNDELLQFLKDQKETGASLLTNLQTNISIENRNTQLESLKIVLQSKVDTEEAKKNRDITLSYSSTDGIPEEVKVDASFARSFIDDYLKPRFDYSKSMSEFIDYMDVAETNKNPFQTTDRFETVKSFAAAQAAAINPTMKDRAVKFNSDFYFNPKDTFAVPLTKELYKQQTAMVAADWNAAKQNANTRIIMDIGNLKNQDLGTWAENAYMYGKDLTKKQDFAELHYTIKGKNLLFDGVKDPGSILKEEFEIPVNTRAQSIGTIFGEYITPEQFANETLKQITDENGLLIQDENKAKVLRALDLDPSLGLEEIKLAIIETIATRPAAEIRENIKRLQEIEKTPTQRELGVDYIERPETNIATVEKTELYNVFKTAGYKGTEEEFYTDYMPDTDPTDMKFLTDATKGRTPVLDIGFLKSEDPFEILSKVGDIDSPPPKISTKTKTDSYFKLGIDDDDDDNKTSSIDADSFLGDYTAFFKK